MADTTPVAPVPINLEPIETIKCPNCANRVRLVGQPPLTETMCPKCGAKVTVPAKMGDYAVLNELTRGAGGPVYEAMKRKDGGGRVAIQVLVTEDDAIRRGFAEMGHRLRGLDEETLAQVVETSVFDEHPILVTELPTTRRLRQLVDAGEALAETRALGIVRDLAVALRAAQNVGLTHGDVNPDNVLLPRSGRAVLINFGTNLFAKKQAKAGKVWGSPAYIAPEKVRGQMPGHAADIYALGCLAYLMLTAQKPFEAENVQESLKKRMNASAPDPRAIRDDLSDATFELIWRSTQPDPAKRPSTYDELITWIDAAIRAAQSAEPQGEAAIAADDPLAALAAGASGAPSAPSPAATATAPGQPAPPPAGAPRPGSRPSAPGHAHGHGHGHHDERPRRRRRSKSDQTAILAVIGGFMLLIFIGLIVAIAMAPDPDAMEPEYRNSKGEIISKEKYEEIQRKNREIEEQFAAQANADAAAKNGGPAPPVRSTAPSGDIEENFTSDLSGRYWFFAPQSYRGERAEGGGYLLTHDGGDDNVIHGLYRVVGAQSSTVELHVAEIDWGSGDGVRGVVFKASDDPFHGVQVEFIHDGGATKMQMVYRTGESDPQVHGEAVTLSGPPTSIKVRLGWDAENLRWTMHYGVDGADAATPHPAGPIEGYPEAGVSPERDAGVFAYNDGFSGTVKLKVTYYARK